MFAFVLCPLCVCKKPEPEQRCPVLSIACTNNSTVTYPEFRGRDGDLHEGRGRARWGQCCYPHKQKSDGPQQVPPASLCVVVLVPGFGTLLSHGNPSCSQHLQGDRTHCPGL